MQIRQNTLLSSPKRDSKQTQSTNQSSRPEEDKRLDLANEPHTKQESDQKRKRAAVDEDLGSQNQDEPKHPLPSPPTSSTLSQEVRQLSILFCSALKLMRVQVQQHSSCSPKLEAVEVPHSLQEPEANRPFQRKRKRSEDAEDLTLRNPDNLTSKRTRIASPNRFNKGQEEVRNINSTNDPSIEHWSKTGYWSPQCFNLNTAMSRPLNNKRSSSGLSYTQSVKEGLNPPQYTPGYEEVLQDAGIYMNEELGQTISDTSQELSEALLNSFFPPPSNSLFGGQSFLLTLDELRNENEPRVQRDITPLLVPCASLLYLHDRILQCRDLSAKIQSEWTKVAPLAGPLPTPDYVVGLKRSAFSRDEISQLQIYSAPNKATVFRDGLYFPFFVCEVSTNCS